MFPSSFTECCPFSWIVAGFAVILMPATEGCVFNVFLPPVLTAISNAVDNDVLRIITSFFIDGANFAFSRLRLKLISFKQLHCPMNRIKSVTKRSAGPAHP